MMTMVIVVMVMMKMKVFSSSVQVINEWDASKKKLPQVREGSDKVARVAI